MNSQQRAFHAAHRAYRWSHPIADDPFPVSCTGESHHGFVPMARVAITAKIGLHRRHVLPDTSFRADLPRALGGAALYRAILLIVFPRERKR